MALGGKGGKGSQQGQGDKILGRKREKISGGSGEGISTGGKKLGEKKGRSHRGGKAFGGMGKGSQQGKGGKDLREEREKIWGQRP